MPNTPICNQPPEWMAPLQALPAQHRTSLAHQVVKQLPVREDGSVRSCDAVLPKPLNGEAVRVLLQGCCV